MFSKACEYGIRASIYIGQQSLIDRRVGQKEIAQAIDSPEAFTAKILQILSKNGIIQSVKGPNGGFDIDKVRMAKTKLSDIVSAIDGDSIYKGCGLGLKDCDELKPCSVHEKFKSIRNDLKDMLENTNLHELANGVNTGLAFLKH